MVVDLDYEPKPKRQGFLYRHPKATRRSVTTAALMNVAVAALLWCVIESVWPRPAHTWYMFLLWVVVAAVVGALFEYQGVNEDGVEDDPPSPRGVV